MSQVDQFKKVLVKYKFHNPTPPENKKAVGKFKKDTLVTILKKKGKYGLFVSLVISLFLWTKKAGFSISIGKIMLIVAAVGTVTAATISAGAYFTVKYIAETRSLEKTEPIEKNELDIMEPTKDTIKDSEKKTAFAPPVTPDKKPEAEKIRYKLAVTGLQYDSSIKDIGRKINNSILAGVVSIGGKDAAARISTIPKKERPKKILSGTIVKLDETYRISAKIVEKGRVILYETETAKSKDDIDRACKALSKKIAGKL
ncbi:MAG: hypothetical protein GY754_04525 [bacterium]|nr:hypothetical protein [bacterium]